MRTQVQQFIVLHCHAALSLLTTLDMQLRGDNEAVYVHRHVQPLLQCKAALVSQMRMTHRMTASKNEFDLLKEFLNKNDEKASWLFLRGPRVENYNFRCQEAVLKLNKDEPG